MTEMKVIFFLSVSLFLSFFACFFFFPFFCFVFLLQ